MRKVKFKKVSPRALRRFTPKNIKKSIVIIMMAFVGSGCVACKCDNSISNTGSLCTIVPKVTRKLFAVPMNADDGTPNQIIFGTTLNQAYLDARINDTDASKRWYPLPSMLNIVSERKDPIMETFDNQTKAIVQQSPREFVGFITPNDGQGATSPQMIAALESLSCVDFGFYIVDVDKNMRGSLSSDGLALNPIRVNAGSQFELQVDPTDKTVNKIKMAFDFNLNEKDSNIRYIACAQWNGADLLNANGLIDFCLFDVDNISSTTVELTIKSNFGSDPSNPIGQKGLLVTDFISSKTGATGKVYDVTADADVTINTVTPNAAPNGDVYALEFNSVAVGHQLNFLAKKKGGDFTCMLDTPVVIPTS